MSTTYTRQSSGNVPSTRPVRRITRRALALALALTLAVVALATVTLHTTHAPTARAACTATGVFAAPDAPAACRRP